MVIDCIFTQSPLVVVLGTTLIGLGIGLAIFAITIGPHKRMRHRLLFSHVETDEDVADASRICGCGECKINSQN